MDRAYEWVTYNTYLVLRRLPCIQVNVVARYDNSDGMLLMFLSNIIICIKYI